MKHGEGEHHLTAHQKAGQVVIWLSTGSKLTTLEIARKTGLTYMGARYMLEMLSLVLPIDYRDKRWQWTGNSLQNSSQK